MELTMAKGKVGYGGKTVLENLDLCLKPGDCLGLVGPNGAGKSTLLRTLAGILPLQAGALTLGDRPLGEWNRREWSRQVSYLPQERELPLAIRRNPLC